MLIDGIHVPLTAPFYRDGRSYLRKLEHNVALYSLGPVAGLVALGPGGEAGALSEPETAEFLEVVGQAAGREKVLVAGIARESVRGALTLAGQAAHAGFDAVLLSPPPNWPELVRDGDRTALTLFFQAVADASPLPVLLGSAAPSRSPELPASLPLPVELIAELAGHENVLGLYDAGLTVERFQAIAAATSNVQREVPVTAVFAPVTRRMLEPRSEATATGANKAAFVSAETLGGGGTALAVAAPPVAATGPVLKTRTKTIGFQVMAVGDCAGLLPLLEAGVAGALPTLAACAPQACYEAFAAFKDGDTALAAEKAARLTAADALLRKLGVAGLKYGCDWNGYFGGNPRLPRLPLRAEQQSQMEAALREVRH